MRILFIQLTAPGLPTGAVHYNSGLATLLASVRRAGHSVELLGLGEADVELLRGCLYRSRAELVGLHYRAVHTALARQVVNILRAGQPLPMIALGPHATADPDDALSTPGITGVAIGEAERSFPEFLSAYADGKDFARTRGLWFNSSAGVIRNELAPLVADLDELPWPERALFGTTELVRATGTVEFSVGRGCPQSCGYCLNARLAERLRGRGPYVRRRSVANLLAEIRQVLADYPGVRRLHFPDCTFAADPAWLTEFAESYAREFAGSCQSNRGGRRLPFTCHVRANSVSPAVAELLHRAGCDAVDIEVVSGSDFIRNDIFRMQTSDAQLAEAFAALRAVGIPVRSRCLIGSPYDSEITVDETVRLHRELKPAAVTVFTYHPFPGTSAAEVCREHGWLSNRSETDFFYNRSLLDLRSLPPLRIAQQRQEMTERILADSGVNRPRSSRLITLPWAWSANGPEPGPINFREDGTYCGPGDGPPQPPDSSLGAGIFAPDWPRVRTGLSLSAGGLSAMCAGPAILLAGLAAPDDWPTGLVWVLVLAGYYGSLIGAVAWAAGHSHCWAAPTGLGGRPFLAGSLTSSLLGIGLLLAAHLRHGVGGVQDRLGLFVMLAGAAALLALSQGLMVGFLRRLAQHILAASLAERVEGYQRWALPFLPVAAVAGLSPLLWSSASVLTSVAPAAAVLGLGAVVLVQFQLRLRRGLAGPAVGESNSSVGPRCAICGSLLGPAAPGDVLRCPRCDRGGPPDSTAAYGARAGKPVGDAGTA